MRIKRSTISVKGSSADQPRVEGTPTLEEVTLKLNQLIGAFNILSKQLAFSRNFDGSIVKVTLPISASPFNIQHNLGVTPKYKVILNQEGNGVISDFAPGWNDKYISLINNGAVEVKATILIARE